MNNTNNIKNTADLFMRKLKATTFSDKGITGLPTGIDSFDDITHGFQDGDLITIAGRPAMGKSSIILYMIKNIAIERREGVLYISPSMTGEKLVKRLLSIVCKIPLGRIMASRFPVEQWDEVERGIAVIRESPIYVDDTPGISIEKLEEQVRLFVNNNKVKAVFVDYLQLIRPRYNPNHTRNDEVADIVYTLKALAMELHIPFIIISQTSRPSNKDTISSFEKPCLSDLRDSGAIEDASDLVIFLHRPEYYHIYKDDNGNDLHGITQLFIEKNLMGYNGLLQLKSNLDTATFEPIHQIDKPIIIDGNPPFTPIDI